MDRSRSHLGLDRLHALHAIVMAAFPAEVRASSYDFLRDACEAYDQHDSVQLHFLQMRVTDVAACYTPLCECREDCACRLVLPQCQYFV